MVVIGSWPYQHSITLDVMHRQNNVCMIYYVDMDRIVSRDECNTLIQDGYILDMKYYTLMSEKLHIYVQSYSKQDFPPEIPDEVQYVCSYEEEIDRVKNSSPILLVNDQDTNVMEDIGAVYNTSIGVWIVDALALKTLRDKKRQKTSGKIQMRQDRCGSLVEITGDVTQHVSLIREIGGTYDEANDIWYVPISSVNKIMHILN
jgi:hypothetical protein